MDADQIVAALGRAADAIGERLRFSSDWGLVEGSDHLHHSDVAADKAGLKVLHEAGFMVLSEESGLTGSGDLTVVLDPLDGSTNAAQRLPWYATSLCAIAEDGPVAAIVVNLATGDRYEAARGLGARCNGETIRPSGVRRLSDAVIGLSALPPRALGWRQFRCLGAAALDLCAVADGRLDGYVDCGVDAHGSWDYLGGMLVCEEAGVAVADALGRDLVVLDHAARRTPVAAATPGMLNELLEARAELYPPQMSPEDTAGSRPAGDGL